MNISDLSGVYPWKDFVQLIPYFYKNSTPRQLLSYFAKLKGYPRKKIRSRVEEVVKMIDMYEWIDKKLGTFSKGMRQKIGILSAIVHDPEVVADIMRADRDNIFFWSF